MKYHFSCIKDDKGYWGKCLELPGCATEGSTKQEFIANCQEALDLYLDDIDEVIEITPSSAIGAA